uniref:Auxin-responsive protein n=1 Tax=Davidia involucrata TaxID=16924 RepID=A0A5B6YND2_DAVIN
MELQLGLALPTQNPIKGFDLNNHAFKSKETVSSEPWINSCGLESNNYVKNKRCSFTEAFGEDVDDHSAKTLPLLLWNGQPNDENDGNEQKNRASHTSNKTEEEENHVVVGWPPIKSWRKKLLHHHQGGRIVNDRTAEGERGASNSMYVKVKMEGVAIGRKINLRLYHSYQTLTNSLISMFAKYQKNEKDDVRYTLAYQDKDGDWMLAGDVPWQTFIETVQRMEILRNAG